jgi:CHAD domain-containing protein
VLGSARDAEVIRDHLHDVVDAEPPDLVVGPVRDRVERTLHAQHSAAHRQLLADLTSSRYIQLLAALDHLPDAVGGSRSEKAASKVLVTEIARTHRRLRRRLEKALGRSGGDADELFHDVRKAAKRVRYAAESASDVLGSKADELATRMEDAQETLGTQQDTVVIRTVLRRLAADAVHDGESSFTYGRLHAAEQQRGARSHAAFLDLVDHHWARRPRWMSEPGFRADW